MYLMLTLLGVIPFLVAAQVIRLGLVDDDELREKGMSQSEAEIVIPALRGSILDVKGRVLASDVMSDKIILDPTVTGFETNKQAHYRVFAEATGMTTNEVAVRIRNRAADRYIVLSRGLSLSSEMTKRVDDVPGARVVREFSRNYNYGQTGSHIRGYVDVDMSGLEGVEKQYDRYLAGVEGRRAAVRDRRGFRKMLPGGRTIEPQHGESVRLTIDIVRQTIMEEELARGAASAGANWATAIAVNPHTGAILGMANVPTFDIHNPSSVPTDFRKNVAIVNRFEPGSTFKLIAAIAAVETDAVAMADTFHTGNGYAKIAGWPVRDTHGYGSIPFTEVISHSSNIGFAQLAEELDHGTYFQYARALGFGQRLGIDLPGEVGGNLARPSVWSGSTLSSMSRGYGVNVTALQILMAYSSLANGGLLVQPYIVAERLDYQNNTTWRASPDSIRRVFSRETAKTLMPAFEEVVLNGTATNAQVNGVRVAGKTGTAKKTGTNGYNSGKYRASFTGFFPAEDPQVALIILMDEPSSSIYGGQTAAPVFQRIVDRWIPTMPEIQRSQGLETLASEDNGTGTERIIEADSDLLTVPRSVLPAIPNLDNMPYSVASRQVSALDFTAASSGRLNKNGFVTQQVPAPGAMAERREKVKLTTAPSPVISEDGLVPDVTGLGARDAAAILASHGFRTRFSGSGTVFRQSPRKGVAAGSEIILTLR